MISLVQQTVRRSDTDHFLVKSVEGLYASSIPLSVSLL